MIDELRRLREITETLTGNGYLKDQAEEWEYALDAVPDYVYIINNRFEIKFVNKALVNRLRIGKSDLYGKICYETILGRDKALDSNSDSHKSNEVVIKEIYVDKLSGWFDMTRSPIYTKESKLIGFICILQDITSKKAAIDDIVYREATLDTIFNAAPIGMGLMDSKTRTIISVNKFMLNLTGYTESDLLNKSDRLLYENDAEFLRVGRECLDRMFVEGTGETEVKIVSKTGLLIDVSIKTAKIKSNTKDKVVFTVTDMTKSKQAEVELKSAFDRFEAVFNLNREAVTVLKSDGTIIDVNPTFEIHTGYSRNEVLGENILSLGMWVSLDDRKLFFDDLTKYGKVEGMRTAFYTKEGAVFDVLLSSSMVVLDGVPHIISVIGKPTEWEVLKDRHASFYGGQLI